MISYKVLEKYIISAGKMIDENRRESCGDNSSYKASILCIRKCSFCDDNTILTKNMSFQL